jgi:hypothetical protein
MDKRELQDILSRQYDTEKWIAVLKFCFGVKGFLQKPLPIGLPSNKKAEAAFELGSFNTTDDRIIGLYLVKVKPEVWLERNKVGLRELLRSVYKYDVDGALIVFEQGAKWRLSFVSEIRTFDEEGSVTKRITEPKRYTYLLGKGEKVRTPVSRLASLVGKPISLEDILKAFSVEALNEEFYKFVARHFYQLVGATEGKGSKEIQHQRVLALPSVDPETKEGAKVFQEFAVRLIGRTVFCWFLKVKKSEAGISLLPEFLLSSNAVRENKGYYHSILERLFFQTLNTPMEDRLEDLPDGCDQVPFLNGGLFEPQPEDYYKPNRTTGMSSNINTLRIPDDWFTEFFENLEQYNFTLDENSVVDIEVSVDPEMLGRIFENLLAEIDPDSGETARKATGSFYTPREIVDYMATQSLVEYLHKQTAVNRDILQGIFQIDRDVVLPVPESEKILIALDHLRILDPACGSGAFPMGVLQKIVMALQKLDRNAEWWKARQISRIHNPILRRQVREKLSQTTVEYARKIGVIQNSLYGVDVQPVAAEISKLRCFLTLVVDENIDETKPNRGVEPLPNLEFKFVTADSLLKLPPERDERGLGNLFGNEVELDELQEIRLDYLQSYGEHKEELKGRFLSLQKQIFKQQLSFGANEDSRAYRISSWNPFSHEKVEWFDPLWMYGVKDFDIIIGNPPYVSYYSNTGSTLTKDRRRYYVNNYDSVVKENDRINSMNLFVERGIKLLKDEGILTYIVNKTFAVLPSYSEIRKYVLQNGRFDYLVSGLDPFKAIVDCVVFGISKEPSQSYSLRWYNGNLDSYQLVSVDQFKDNRNLEFHSSKDSSIIAKIEKAKNVLEDILTINRGVNIGGHFEDFLSDHKKDDEYFKFISGIKSLEKFTYTWNKTNDCYFKFDQKLESKLRSKGSTMVLGNPERYLKEKLFIPESAQYLLASYVKERVYSAYGIMVGTQADEKYDVKYACALINSKLYTFYAIEKEILRKGSKATPHVGVKGLKSIPVHLASDEQQNVFVNLVDYILYLKKQDPEKKVNDNVTNAHMVQLFEEINDALVYELYFTEDFASESVFFMKYAEKLFVNIAALNKDEKGQSINKIFETLSEKDNEIRQNLKVMDTRLSKLVMPIKSK